MAPAKTKGTLSMAWFQAVPSSEPQTMKVLSRTLRPSMSGVLASWSRRYAKRSEYQR